MKISTFKLEEYLAKYEFSSPYLLCCSDAESFTVQEIIELATIEDRKLWDNLCLNYTEPYGLPKLREQIAASLYPGLEDKNILCFAGAEEGIFASLHILCEPGDHVIILSPCYQALEEIPRLKGSEVSTVMLREENAWRIDLAEIQQKIKSNTKVIVINFPHNPTGQIITQQELLDLVKLCDKHELWLFSDEVYRLLGNPEEPWSMPAACMYSKAISLGVMSKAFGMGGLRIGWISCQDSKLLHQVKKMKDYLSICNSAPAEILSLIALKNKDKILNRNNNIVADNLKLLDEFMEEYQDLFEWVRPQGGCVGFVNYKDQIPVDNFTEQLIKEKGVLLMPASTYDYKSNHFRIGFGRTNMPEALGKLKEFIVQNLVDNHLT